MQQQPLPPLLLHLLLPLPLLRSLQLVLNLFLLSPPLPSPFLLRVLPPPSPPLLRLPPLSSLLLLVAMPSLQRVRHPRSPLLPLVPRQSLLRLLLPRVPRQSLLRLLLPRVPRPSLLRLLPPRVPRPSLLRLLPPRVPQRRRVPLRNPLLRVRALEQQLLVLPVLALLLWLFPVLPPLSLPSTRLPLRPSSLMRICLPSARCWLTMALTRP